MRASVILGPAITLAYLAVISSPIVDHPQALLVLLVGTLGAAVMIDRGHVALRRKRPVSGLVNLMLLSAIKKRARRIYLRSDGDQLAVWFEHSGGQDLELNSRLELHRAIVGELRWRLGRWGVNGALTMWLGGRWITVRVRCDHIGGALARIDLEVRLPAH